MEYVVYERPPKIVQITWDDILSGDIGKLTDTTDLYDSDQMDLTSTITHKSENISKRLASTTDAEKLIELLQGFNRRYADLFCVPKKELFNTFLRPKRNKGMKAVFNAIFKSQKKYVECN